MHWQTGAGRLSYAGNFTAQRVNIIGNLLFLPRICVKIAVTAAMCAKRDMNIQAKIFHFKIRISQPFPVAKVS
jgi:ABC-type iron transport system FetAB ATPase subunit